MKKIIFTRIGYECWDVINCIYRDLNNLFVKDRKENKWYRTSANLFLEATHYATTRKKKFNVDDFFWNFYETEKKGTGYVVGDLRGKQELIKKVKHICNL